MPSSTRRRNASKTLLKTWTWSMTWSAVAPANAPGRRYGTPYWRKCRTADNSDSGTALRGPGGFWPAFRFNVEHYRIGDIMKIQKLRSTALVPVSYTHLRAHET